MTDRPGLGDFAVRLVDSARNLHDDQVRFLQKYFDEHQLKEVTVKDEVWEAL